MHGRMPERREHKRITRLRAGGGPARNRPESDEAVLFRLLVGQPCNNTIICISHPVASTLSLLDRVIASATHPLVGLHPQHRSAIRL